MRSNVIYSFAAIFAAFTQFAAVFVAFGGRAGRTGAFDTLGPIRSAADKTAG